MVASADAPVAVGRDERERVGVGPGKGGADDVRRQFREPAQPALLPRSYDCRDSTLVSDGGAGGGEREPTPRAFPAPPHRPGRRCAAPSTVHPEQEGERSPAARAEILTQAGAGNATARQDKVEKHIGTTLARKSSRVARGFVPKA